MRVLYAVAIMGLLVGPGYAQDHVPRYGEKDPEKTREQIQAEKDADRAYKRSLHNIPDKGPVDPWGAVRSTDAPKAATSGTDSQKTSMAKSKGKTGAVK